MNTAVVVARRISGCGRGEIYLILIRVLQVDFSELHGVCIRLPCFQGAKSRILCEVRELGQACAQTQHRSHHPEDHEAHGKVSFNGL